MQPHLRVSKEKVSPRTMEYGRREGRKFGVHSINMYLGYLLCLEVKPKACCLACPSTLLPVAYASDLRAWPPPLYWTGFLVGNPQEFPLSIQVPFPPFLVPTTSQHLSSPSVSLGDASVVLPSPFSVPYSYLLLKAELCSPPKSIYWNPNPLYLGV